MKKTDEQPDKVTALIESLGFSMYEPSIWLNTIIVTCPRPGLCGSVWRSFFALKPKGYGIVILYRENGEVKYFTSSEPLRT